MRVSPRTLRNWKTKATIPAKVGRLTNRPTFVILRTITKEWRKQGKPGWRPVKAVLKSIPTRQIQKIIKELKKKDRFKARNRLERVSTHIKIHAPNIMLALDGAHHPAKTNDLIVTKDPCCMQIDIANCVADLASKDVLFYLQKLKGQKKLPLVACTDNGSPFCAKLIENFFEENKIIHLKSLPHTPQHNSACESAVKDVKKQILDGKTVSETLTILNKNLRRKKLNWQTPTEYEKQFHQASNLPERENFFNEAKTAIQKALIGTKTALERRKAERKAILTTLENLGLITITIGRTTNSPTKELNL